MHAQVSVLIADDHPVTRLGVSQFLAKASDIQVLGEAENGKQALERTLSLQPDILLLDMELGDISGLEVIRQLIENGSQTKILVLSAYDEINYIRGTLGRGASGYLLKDEAPRYLLDAIRGVAMGEKRWLSDEIRNKVFPEPGDPFQQLTGREKDVLRRIAKAMTNAEIAAELEISEKTVEKYVGALYEKLRVASRVDAAVYAVQMGWAGED